MSYFLENWGGFVGVLGLVITIVGVIFSIAAFQRAGKARHAAEAAEFASQETREAITRILTKVELERAIALVQWLKDLHRESRWETSLQHYQSLRAMLVAIASRHTTPPPGLRQQLSEAIPQITEMENQVDTAIGEQSEPSESQGFNRILNEIQACLENISGSIYP